MEKLSKWYFQCIMGLVVGIFVTTGVYFIETRPQKKISNSYFSIANHDAELAMRVAKHGDEMRPSRSVEQAVDRLTSSIGAFSKQFQDGVQF